MDNKEVLDTLRRIVNTPAKSLTADDKAFVEDLANENGVQVRRKGCSSCYVDSAVELFGKLSKSEESDEAGDGRKYVLRDGVDVLFNGVRVNAVTLTDEMAANLVAFGFDASFFSKMPSDED